jgi:hypothetical protein
MTEAADLMRREFFAAFPPPDDLDIFCLTDWKDLPATEKAAHITTIWTNPMQKQQEGANV